MSFFSCGCSIGVVALFCLASRSSSPSEKVVAGSGWD